MVVAEMLGLAAALIEVGTSEVGMNAEDSAAAPAVVEVLQRPPKAQQSDAAVHNSIGHIQLRGTGLGNVPAKGTGNSMRSDRTHLVCVRRLGTASEPAHIVDGTAASEGSLRRCGW